MRSLNLKELSKVMKLMNNKRWLFYLTISISAICVGAFSIINSYVYKDIINSITNNDVALLNNAVRLALISLLLACIISPISGFICAYISKETIYELRLNLFKHIIRLPRSFFDKNHSGEVISIMTNDVKKIDEIYDGELYNVIFHFLVGVAATYTIIKLNVILALIMIFFGILTTLTNTLFAKPISKISDNVQKYIGKSTERFLDIISGVRTIKLYNINKDIVGKYDKENKHVVDEGIKLTKKEAKKSSTNILLSSLTFLGVLGPGALMVYNNTIDLGTVIAIISLKLQVFCLFEEVGDFFATLQKSLSGSKRVFKLLDQSIEEDISDNYYQKSLSDSEIILKDVSHHYTKLNVLNEITMEFNKNEITAIVGFSGSGKSTIIKLLLGFYKPTNGKVMFNGNNNKKINLYELRDKISYVSQKPILFNDTIIENLKYGNPNATKEEIINVCKLTNCHVFILDMEFKYQTIIGEGGSRLSGGQKQRIALARALLKDSSIILLDEATSALDSESEIIIENTLSKLKDDKTIIIIAHKLSTIKDADSIYVLDQGKVIEKGTHNELLDNNKTYKLLYNSAN